MIRTEIKGFKLNIGEHEGLPCTLPMSVFGTLHSAGITPNPYFAENFSAYSAYSSLEAVLTSEFEVDRMSYSMRGCILSVHRIDSPFLLELNGEQIASSDKSTDDLRVNVKDKIKEGINVLKIVLYPSRCSEISDGVRLSRLSVGGCSMVSYNYDVISAIRTRREICSDYVRLHINVDPYEDNGSTRTVATLVSPGGRVFYCGLVNNYGYIDITEPNYWWPSGLGVQNLYKLSVNLYYDSEIVDSKDVNVGLVRFESEEVSGLDVPHIFVNGTSLYSRGVCYLDDDIFLPMLREGRVRQLLTDCKRAGCNTVVVRDLGYFPEESFFGICDEVGLVAWVELNCSAGSSKSIDQIKRSVIASAYHASFGVLVLSGDEGIKYREALDDVFNDKVTIALKSLDESILSSRPSLPRIETVYSFVDKRDANIFSPEMEYHTTLADNKELISSASYRYPSGLGEIAYVTQMQEAYDLSRKIDKVRRERGNVLHTILTRLNDPWGQISESLIDYRGRAKAQTYLLRSLFAPVRVGAVNDGTRVTFFVSNETRSTYNGKLTYSVTTASGEVVFSDGFAISIPEISASDIMTIDLYEAVSGREDECFVNYSVSDGLITTSKGVLFFTTPKKFKFKEPNITADITGSGTHFTLSISSDVFVSGLEMSFEDTEAVFDENFLDITDKSPLRIEFTTDKAIAAPILRRQLVLRSAYSIGR